MNVAAFYEALRPSSDDVSNTCRQLLDPGKWMLQASFEQLAGSCSCLGGGLKKHEVLR